MYRLTQLLEKEIPMFSGIYWAYDRMDMLVMLKEKMPRYNYIVGTLCSMMGYMSMGIDAISMTAMNCMPELMKDMFEYMMNKKYMEAMQLMDRINKRIAEMNRMDDMDWMMVMKREMDKLNLKMGPMRRPK